MRQSITLDSKDVKKLIAEKYGVEEKDVVASKYSYTVLLKEMDDECPTASVSRY